MSKLRILSGQAVCRILSEHGFNEVRHRGSHILLQKNLNGSTITVLVPDHSEIHIGTLQSIIRQSQLSRALFQAW